MASRYNSPRKPVRRLDGPSSSLKMTFPPPMTLEEEIALFEAWARTKDPRLREHMILANMPLVRKVVGQWYHRNEGSSFHDLLQQGAMGLTEGFDHFDPARGVKFFTYARWWVEARIRSSLHAKGLIHTPKGNPALKVAFFDDLDPEARDGSGGRITLDLVHTGEERLVEQDLTGRRLALVMEAWHTLLTPRERIILTLRNEEVPLAEVGRRLGITRERVRQLESKARERVMKYLRLHADDDMWEAGSKPPNEPAAPEECIEAGSKEAVA